MKPPFMPKPAPPLPPAAGGATAKVIGALLIIPAAILTVVTLVIPTVRTIGASRRDENVISGESSGVGGDNYDLLFEEAGYWDSFWFALSLAVAPILVAVVVAPLVSAACDWAGRWARLTIRIVLSVAIVVFSPVALAIAWQRALGDDEPPPLADPGTADDTVRESLGAMTFGIVCAIGVLLFLPVFRARRQRLPMWPTLFTVAGLAVLATVAFALQQFAVPFVMTGFGPNETTMTPLGATYIWAFQFGHLGVGAAASVMLLAALAMLGVIAVLVIALTRLRVSLLPWTSRRPVPAAAMPPPEAPTAAQPISMPPPGAPPPTAYPPATGYPPPSGVNVGAVIVAALAIVAVVAALVINALPWLDALSGEDPQTPADMQRNTWVPPFTWSFVSVGAAYVAALGIGGLRPLGRHSEWLLMPFAPWLFVGAAPLSIEFFKALRDDDQLNTTAALRPPIMISIISLVILTVVCRGQSERWQRQVAGGATAGDMFFRTVVLPTMPLAGLMIVLTVFVNAQDLWWPHLVAIDPEHQTTSVALLQNTRAFAQGHISVAAATPVLAVVLGLAALVVLQVLYLDRMVAATGRSIDPDATPMPMPPAGPQSPGTAPTVGYPGGPPSPAYPPPPAATTPPAPAPPG